MVEYIPILILDEDDTNSRESLSLRDFLEEIDNHVKNVKGATLDNVFVNLGSTDYLDDEFFELSLAELTFSVKKDD